MAGTSSTFSMPTPPIFDGENYEYWSIKMKLFLRANALWEIVEEGYQERTEGVQYTETQLQKMKDDELKDAKALSYLLNAVTSTIFPRIMRAPSAKSAWCLLQEEFQGDNRVRAIRLNYLRKDFENMKMEENEDTKVYTSRLLDVVNQMKTYGEDITYARIVHKILETLTTTESSTKAPSETMNTRNISTSKSDVPSPPSSSGGGGKASMQPKRIPLSDKEIEAVMLGGCI